VVERTADELRTAMRCQIGWAPTIVVIDNEGRDITALYEVN